MLQSAFPIAMPDLQPTFDADSSVKTKVGPKVTLIALLLLLLIIINIIIVMMIIIIIILVCILNSLHSIIFK